MEEAANDNNENTESRDRTGSTTSGGSIGGGSTTHQNGANEHVPNERVSCNSTATAADSVEQLPSPCSASAGPLPSSASHSEDDDRTRIPSEKTDSSRSSETVRTGYLFFVFTWHRDSMRDSQYL